MIKAVIFDLDGVVRHFDPAAIDIIEREHGLESGAIFDAAFSQPLLTEVTTGRITRKGWVTRVGELINAPAAAILWAQQPARADSAVLRLSDELRRNGFRSVILTNGTDTIPAEVAQQGIAPHFDAVYNSATIGFAKPDVRAFEHVLNDLGLTAQQTFFTDDSSSKLPYAAQLGITTHQFTDLAGLHRALNSAGVFPGQK